MRRRFTTAFIALLVALAATTAATGDAQAQEVPPWCAWGCMAATWEVSDIYSTEDLFWYYQGCLSGCDN